MQKTLKNLLFVLIFVFGTVTLSLAASIALLPQAAKLEVLPKNEHTDQSSKHQDHREDDEALIESGTWLPLHQDFVSNN